MSSSIFNSSLYLLSFALLLQSVLGADPLFQFCPSSENLTSYGPYEHNLNTLMGYLYFKVPPTGFGLGSVGLNQDQANGLALCRGDVSASDCKACVADAGSEIRRRCPNNKRAAIWYDNCLLKYSNEDFFGKIDTEVRFYAWNSQNATDPTYFNQKTKELLGRLAEEASATPKMYAGGELEYGEKMKLYGLVQCTRDLSSIDCKECLDGAISELPDCCDGKEGGRVVGGSCNIRYETYSFLNA